MNIASAEFVTSVAKAEKPFNTELPEIAVAGRSNVGKSSFINAVVGRKIAKSSAEPGRTRLINYFLCNKNFYLVDLPGYGYAKVSDDEKEKWGKIIEFYLRNSRCIKCVLVLLDVRRDVGAQDLQLIEYLRYYGLNYRVILTKSDKLSRMQVLARKKQIACALQVSEDLIAFSALKGSGKDEVLALLSEYII